MKDSTLRQEMALLVERLHQAPDSGQTAAEILAYTQEQLAADHASITLNRSGGKLQTVAPSDPIVEEADRLQEEFGEGPSIDTAWAADTFASQDLAVDSRWPHWGPRAAELGLGAALGTALGNKAGDRRVGAMNLYWEQPRIITADEVALAQLITRHAALALVASLTVEGLNLALDGRKRIGQAQGILMERHALTEEQAFAVLKRYSQDHNIKLRDLAEQLVRDRELPRNRPSELDVSRDDAHVEAVPTR